MGQKIGAMIILYPRDDSPTLDELMTLYTSVGWTAYTDDQERLQATITASLKVSTARENG